MKLKMRKFAIVGIIIAVFFAGNAVLIANWLAEYGIQDKANWIRENFLTGTTITVIVALLILLVDPGSKRAGLRRSCPVCDKHLFGNPNYCSDCGSKLHT